MLIITGDRKCIKIKKFILDVKLPVYTICWRIKMK